MPKKNGFPDSVQPGIPKLQETPSGWSKAPLGKYLKEIKRPVKMKDRDEYQLVTVKRNRGGAEERERLLGKEIKVKSQFFVRDGDFLISKRQIVHGACALVPHELDGAIVSNEYAVLGSDGGLDLKFLQYLSETVYFQQTCFQSSIGVAIEKMVFKLDRWLKWSFILPPLTEQKKIARILSTWDAAIEKVEKLIENSRRQKKALMQQLLTGKKRLPGFQNSPWLMKPLKKVAHSFSGGTPSRNRNDYYDGNIPWIKSGEVNARRISSTEELITENGLKNSAAKIVPAGSILVAMYGATAGKIAINEIDAAINQAILAIQPSKLINNSFLFHFLELEMTKVTKFVQGGQPNLNSKIINSISIPVPAIGEQICIGKILDAADKQIYELLTLLNIFSQEKKSLMQQLLTGKRRVKVDE